VTAVTPRRGARQPGLVTLVRGDVRELAAIETAALLADTVRAQVLGCVLPVRPRAGLELVRDLAGDCVGRWTAWDDVAGGAFEDVRGLVISGHTWREAARHVWPALERCPVYVQHRRPALHRSVLVAVDSPSTQAALARRLEPMMERPGLRITVAFASVPSWASSMAAALGYPVFVQRPPEERFPWPLALRGATGVSLPTTPLWAITTLADHLRPDLVVLGLHRHWIREPWLAHPTAWHLSRELRTDVLICPVG
jgi:hypothetical protein